jgi:hypothetical protein
MEDPINVSNVFAYENGSGVEWVEGGGLLPNVILAEASLWNLVVSPLTPTRLVAGVRYHDRSLIVCPLVYKVNLGCVVPFDENNVKAKQFTFQE